MRSVRLLIVCCVGMGSVFFVGISPLYAADATDYQRKEEKLEKDIKETKKEVTELQSDLSHISGVLTTVTRKVTSTKDQIERITGEIAQRTESLTALEKKISFQRAVVKAALRELYAAESDYRTPTQQLLVTTQTLQDRDHMVILRDRVMEELRTLSAEQSQMEKEKGELADRHRQHQALLTQQQKEQQTLVVEKNETAQDLQEKQASLADLQSELSSVRSKLSALLGSSFSTDDVVDAARFASKRTGVRKDFILGELVVETNLGKFTGGCTYKESKMGDRNAEIFKRIAKDLGKDYKKLKVSCPLSYGIGGAMGVAQFMPTTWAGYEKRIEDATGHDPANPWSLADGVTAMALYLADKGADHRSGEKEAAKRYYCGSSASRYWNTKCEDYAKKVLYWADNYERLLKD